jgi:hypothetical protein
VPIPGTWQAGSSWFRVAAMWLSIGSRERWQQGAGRGRRRWKRSILRALQGSLARGAARGNFRRLSTILHVPFHFQLPTAPCQGTAAASSRQIAKYGSSATVSHTDSNCCRTGRCKLS